jgi:hypothetical protein
VAPEQLPVLCRRCGGAARLLDAQSIECPWCGQRDQLPADAMLRSIDLRGRIDAARASLARLDGLTLAMARLYEGPGGVARVLVPFALVFGALLASNLVGAARSAAAAPASLRLCLALNALSTSSLLWTLPLGVAAGLLVARLRYRSRVRPWLLARAPLVEGAPARCRVCGAPLETAAARELFIPCRFCRTPNLLVGAVFADRARRLDDERRFHHERVVGAAMAASGVGAGLDRVLYASMVGSWLLSIALTALVQRFVCRW